MPDREVDVEKKKTPNVKINEKVEQSLKEIDAFGLAEQKDKKKEAEKQKQQSTCFSKRREIKEKGGSLVCVGVKEERQRRKS